MVALEKRNTYFLLLNNDEKGRIALFFVPFSLKNSDERNITHMKEREVKITTHGSFDTELMSEAEQRAFYAALLANVLKQLRRKREEAE